jgi:hypothetical protein
VRPHLRHTSRLTGRPDGTQPALVLEGAPSSDNIFYQLCPTFLLLPLVACDDRDDHRPANRSLPAPRLVIELVAWAREAPEIKSGRQ